MKPIVVFGNSIAALASACSLAGHGVPVRLVAQGCESGRPFGGHFAGCPVDDHRFDLGMLLLEFTSFSSDPAAEIESYTCEVRSDVGRFASHVRTFIEDLGIEFTQTRTPSMFVEGKVLDDIIISNQLSALAALEDGTRARIRGELDVCLETRSSRLHPRNRNSWSLDREFSLEAVSLASHGPTFHGLFIEPLCRKLTGVGTESLAAKFHRAAWLPLYYPETLCAELDGDSQPLPPTRFHYPVGSGFHVVVEKLEERVRSSEEVELLDDELADLEASDSAAMVRLKSGRELEAARVVWSLAQEPLLALKGHRLDEEPTAKASIGFAFVSVASTSVERPFSTLHVVDEDPFFYRVTNQTANSSVASRATRMIVEYSLDECERRSLRERSAVEAEIRRGLERLDILDRAPRDLTITIREARDALVLPTPDGVRCFQERNRCVREAYPDVLFVGSSAPYGFGSLNDQLVQGMKVGRLLGR